MPGRSCPQARLASDERVWGPFSSRRAYGQLLRVESELYGGSAMDSKSTTMASKISFLFTNNKTDVPGAHQDLATSVSSILSIHKKHSGEIRIEPKTRYLDNG